MLGLNHLRKCEITSVGEVENIEEIAQVLNCKVGALPTTYLGATVWCFEQRSCSVKSGDRE